MVHNTQVNHCGDRECHETTLNLNSQSDSRPKHYPFLIFVIFLLSYDVFCAKNKQTKQQQQEQQQQQQKGKGKARIKGKYSQFLFLRHIFVWHPSASLHISLSGNKRTTPITLLHRSYHNYTFLTANKSFCTLS